MATLLRRLTLRCPFAMERTPDGGFVIAGESRSSDGDLTANAGFADYWVLKLDANFDINGNDPIWKRGETAYAHALTSDGGYILKVLRTLMMVTSVEHGSGAYGLVKLEQNGNIQWQRPCGSSNIDYGFSSSNVWMAPFGLVTPGHLEAMSQHHKVAQTVGGPFGYEWSTISEWSHGGSEQMGAVAY